MIGLLGKSRLLRRRKPKQSAVKLDKRSLHALAALLLLSQLPHLLHLPIWVSALGVSIIGLKLLAHYSPSTAINFLLTPVSLIVIAVSGAILVRTHYGYFLGRDPCVAFLFILVSAKFAELKRPAESTLLLCLAGFLLMTQYFYSQSILSALITLPAVLALGNALAVIRDSTNAPKTKQNLRMVGKLLLQGAPLAALLFVVFPRLPGPLWSLPDDATAKTGLSDSMSPGSIGSLSLSDEVAFRVEFKGSPPPPDQRYWRGPVLNEFDGFNWSASTNPTRIQVSGSQRPNSLEYTVMMQPNHQRWLFALDYPTSVPMSDTVDEADSRIMARITADLQLKSSKPITQVVRYKQSSSLSDKFKPPIRPEPIQTQLAGQNPKTMAFAAQMRAQAGSDRQYIENLLRHFNQENFHYTLQPSLLGNSPVDEFLFNTREGFCEHYASAFVVLLRAAAIPARVVTGYLGGEMNGNYMIVRQSDAHAWAEAFIDGHWIRYDPTGAVAPARVDTSMAAALGDGEPIPMMARSGNGWLKRFKLSMDEMNHDWQRLVVNFNNESQNRIWQKLGFPKLQLWQITILVLIISAIWCFAVLGMPLRRASGKTPADRMWNRYVRTLGRLGIQRETTETPNQLINRAAESLPKSSLIKSVGDDLVKLRFHRPDSATNAALNASIKRGLTKLYMHSLMNRAG